MINLRGTVMMGHLLMLVMLPMVRQMKNESLERQLYLTLPELYPQPGKTVLLIRRFGILSVPGHRRAPSPCRAYPELFAVLGGQTPDLRGLFLRGYGGKSAALGATQDQATASSGIQIATAFIDLGGGGWDGWAYAPYPQAGGSWTTLPGTGDETRPVNTAVRYLVRARP